MARSKTISLKGPAAKAFIEMASEGPKTDEDVLAGTATIIHMYVQAGDLPKAVQVLKSFLANGRSKPFNSQAESTNWPSNGLYCPICKKPQVSTPSGTSCPNGHGGLYGVEKV